MKEGPGLFLFCLLFSLFCLLSPDLSFAGDSQKTRAEILRKEKRLQIVHKEIKEKKRDIETLKKKETTILAELDSIDRALSKKTEELKGIERNLKQVEERISVTEHNLSGLIKERERLTRALEGRLVAMYKMRGGGEVRVLFSSDSLPDLSRRYKYMKAVVDYDARLIRGYRENQLSLEAEGKRLKWLKGEMLSLKGDVEDKKQGIEEERGRRLSLLKMVRKEKETYLLVLNELDKAGRELQDFIDRLRKDLAREIPPSTTGFGAMKGRLPMPVDGRVVSFYGRVQHPRFHTTTFNNGIVIDAPLGAEVRSIYKGRVIFSDWLKGYGRVLIIDHGDGYYTLLAHLSTALKGPGEEVKEGDVVALVGDTGFLNGPGLYFEIRQRGVTRDPLEWVAYKSGNR